MPEPLNEGRALNADVSPDVAPRDPSPLALRILAHDGEPFLGGTVLRVFLARRPEGHDPTRLARAVSTLLAMPEIVAATPRVLVMPAGTGRIEAQPLDDGEWTALNRIHSRALIADWYVRFARELPVSHPPIALGLDGAAYIGEDFVADKAVQVALTIEDRALTTITAKTKPRHADEAALLDVAWDETRDRPTSDALALHNPVTSIAGVPALVLVCHDAAAFSGRSRAASKPGGTPDIIRAQYDAILDAADAPRIAINLLHRLPRREDARTMTSSVFQSAHTALHARGLRIIAVSGLNPGCALRAFERLSVQLRCDARRIDVLLAS